MTLDEAIEHAYNASLKMACNKETRTCSQEHLQLAKWLEELKLYRRHYPLPKDDSTY